MNSPKTYEIMELTQKYQIDEYLSFNVFIHRVNAVTQSFHYTCKSKGGCPFDTCFKPIVLDDLMNDSIENIHSVSFGLVNY